MSETQILAVARRTAGTSDQGWPFLLDDGRVTWNEAPLELGGTGFSKAIAACLQAPKIDVSRMPDPGDGMVGDPDNGPFLTPEDGRISLDIGCTRILTEKLAGTGNASLIVDSADLATHLIDEGLPDWQVEVWR